MTILKYIESGFYQQHIRVLSKIMFYLLQGGGTYIYSTNMQIYTMCAYICICVYMYTYTWKCTYMTCVDKSRRWSIFSPLSATLSGAAACVRPELAKHQKEKPSRNISFPGALGQTPLVSKGSGTPVEIIISAP